MNEHENPVKPESEAIAEQLNEAIEESRIPDPGLYRDLPEGTYHQIWKAISSSLLHQLKRSPMHARHYLEAPQDPTPAMQLGTAVHCAILQPEIFAELYMGIPKFDLRTTVGKAAARMFMQANPGKRFLPVAEFNKCLRIREVAMQTPIVRRLVEGRGDFELSFAWKDPKTGLVCKGRADRVSWEVGGGTIVDLKTCRDARLFAFERTIFARSYHNQGAFYVDGIRAQNIAIEHYTTIAIESDAPHAIAVYRMRDEVIDLARDENRRLVDLFDECRKSGIWPGYGEGIVDVGLPQYAINAMED